jgi:hypothetical protein
MHCDSHEPVSVVSRFATLTLSRQVCSHLETQTHVIPGNPVLPHITVLSLPPEQEVRVVGIDEWVRPVPSKQAVAWG